LVEVHLVPVPAVDEVFPKIVSGIERACSKGGGDLTAAYLWQECRASRAFLLIAVDGEILGACIWRFETWAGKSVMKCLAAWGTRMAEWEPAMREKSETLARLGGAVKILADGRTGWARRYPKARVVRVLYEVDL
jgi:hypothetical protein